MTPTLEKTLTVVQSFIAQQGGDAASLTPKSKLLQDGYLDSFALVELIATMQEKLGIAIDEGALIPEDFDSIETLHARLREISDV